MTTSLARPPTGACSAAPSPIGSASLAGGELVVLQHADRHVLVGCAGTISPAQIAFIIRHSTGFIQVALPESVCDALILPEATPATRRTSSAGFGQCVAVDAAEGIGTGISAIDRSRTARLLADPRTVPQDLTRPGHTVPVRVSPTLLRTRGSVAAAALAATDIADHRYSGAVFADLQGITDPTLLADSSDAAAFAEHFDLTYFVDHPAV